MGNYSVPEKIRLIRSKGTVVKFIKGHYYVYEYKSTSTKVIKPDGSVGWKSKTKTGACIGQITLKDGFISNQNKTTYSEVTIYEFGCYYFIKTHANATLEKLKKFFNLKEVNSNLLDYNHR